MTSAQGRIRKAFNLAARTAGIAVLTLAVTAGALSGWKAHALRTADPVGRAMTTGEVMMAKTIFGDTIDYGRVRLHRAPHEGDLSISIGDDIYLESSALQQPDISAPGVGTSVKQALGHELTHVWQSQTCSLYTTMAQSFRTIPGRLLYLFTGESGYYRYSPASDKKFAAGNEEQQARMAETYLGAQETLRSPVCVAALGGSMQNGLCVNSRMQIDNLAPRIRPSLPLPGWKQ